jgi:hypothetical protein
MTINELRIGVWVNDLNGNPFKIEDAEDIADFEQFENAYPITLTEEWLKRIDMATHDCIWHNFASDDGGYFLWVGGHKQYIKYLHQFQNIAFALTNTELEIKPS